MYIDSAIVPSRPIKPLHSDPLDGGHGGAEETVGDDLPGLRKFSDLVAQPQVEANFSLVSGVRISAVQLLKLSM